MGLAFWRAGKDNPPVQKAVVAEPVAPNAAGSDAAGSNVAGSKAVGSKAAAFKAALATIKASPLALGPAPNPSKAAAGSGDLDLRTIWQTLLRKRSWIIVPTVLAAALSMSVVNLVTPRYKSEARILIDGRENILDRKSVV